MGKPTNSVAINAMFFRNTDQIRLYNTSSGTARSLAVANATEIPRLAAPAHCEVSIYVHKIPEALATCIWSNIFLWFSLHIINPVQCWQNSLLHLFAAEPFVQCCIKNTAYACLCRGTVRLSQCLHHCSTATRLKRWERDKTSLLSWWDLSWQA